MRHIRGRFPSFYAFSSSSQFSSAGETKPGAQNFFLSYAQREKVSFYLFIYSYVKGLIFFLDTLHTFAVPDHTYSLHCISKHALHCHA